MTYSKEVNLMYVLLLSPPPLAMPPLSVAFGKGREPGWGKNKLKNEEITKTRKTKKGREPGGAGRRAEPGAGQLRLPGRQPGRGVART